MTISQREWRERWPNFDAAEMACSDGTPFPINDQTIDFLDKLQALRSHLNFPFRITSAYRTPAYNKAIGGASDSMHVAGLAVDVHCYHAAAFRLVTAAPRFGFLGIGVKQKGPLSGRFIHIDVRPEQAIWSY